MTTLYSPIARQTKWMLPVLALFTALPAYSQDIDHPLDLRSAVDMAVSNNPSLRQTGEIVNQAQAAIPVARAAIFPNLSLIATGAEKRDALSLNNTGAGFGSDTYNTYETDLHLTQPLFQIGTFSAIDVVKKTRDIDRLNVEIAVRTTSNQVLDAYFTVVLDERNLDTLKREYRFEEEAFHTARSRARTGRGQELDALQTETQLALLKTQVATAANQVQIDAATLANLLGDRQAREFHVKDRLEAPPVSVIDHEVNLANFRLPELESNKIQISQIDDQKRVTLGQNLPSLAFTGDYIYSAYKQADLFDSSSNAWAVSLQLTIPIFSGLSSFYSQQVLNSQRLQLEYGRQVIENTTNLNQVTSRKQLETAEQSIIEGREALRLAVASSDEARRMYRFATIDFLNFLQVETALVQAESSFNQYKYNYIAALGNYYVASGQQIGGLIDLLEKANQ